jgi:hypothetical protein
MGAGVGVVDADEEVEVEVEVWETVKVTLKVVGTTVVIWTSRLPDRVIVVTVAEPVVAERYIEGEVVVGVETEELEDWAETWASRNEAVMMSRRILRVHIT